MNKNNFKSIGALLAGFIAVFGLSVGTDTVLERLGIFPQLNDPGSYVPWMLMLALLYCSIYTIAGGYITATLAPGRPMLHAIILGAIGFVFATLGAIANWNKTGLSTNWYPILLILVTLPSVWLGVKIRSGFEFQNT
jgi:ABC-type Na+ efflux pump permease subunit